MFNLESEDIIPNKGKSVYWGNSAPTKFIDDLDKKKHIVHFYENREYAKTIHFKHHCKKGLLIY